MLFNPLKTSGYYTHRKGWHFEKKKKKQNYVLQKQYICIS